jgi:heterodisulfide reductase subunit D
MATIPTMAEALIAGKSVDYLFWVGCAGSFDARAQKVSLALVEIMNKAAISYAILGDEEKCTGDPARRAGNEFLFQMLAIQNIETLHQYQVKKIITTCPHCFNTLKNEYPDLGGRFEVLHHSQVIHDWISTGRIKVKEKSAEKITYHDSCYLGRVNGIYEVPREVLDTITNELVEMERSKSQGLCCGAGGAQMFKEDEPGSKRINTERIEEALSTGAQTIISNCPFCLTMLTDGVKAKDKQESVMVYDLAELVLKSI